MAELIEAVHKEIILAHLFNQRQTAQGRFPGQAKPIGAPLHSAAENRSISSPAVRVPTAKISDGSRLATRTFQDVFSLKANPEERTVSPAAIHKARVKPLNRVISTSPSAPPPAAPKASQT